MTYSRYYGHTYVRSQGRLKVSPQVLQNNLSVPPVLLCSERVDCSGSGGIDENLLFKLLSEAGVLFEYDCSSNIDEPLSSRLLPEVAGVVEWDCSGDINELLLLSSKVGAGISFSEDVLLRRYGLCITGFRSFSQAKGLT